jgi:DNA-binding FrmR family transcriptional regulator
MYQCDIENKKLINRINRISGQVNSLKSKLIEDVSKTEHKDPYEIIRQLSAIKGAVNGMITSYIEHFAKSHLVTEIRESKDNNEAMAQMDTLVDIMKSFSK